MESDESEGNFMEWMKGIVLEGVDSFDMIYLTKLSINSSIELFSLCVDYRKFIELSTIGLFSFRWMHFYNCDKVRKQMSNTYLQLPFQKNKPSKA
jgi:hypothetical protein